MNRDEMLARMQDTSLWDVVVIGGGATGIGIAIDSASRGYTTLLVEQDDFGKGTSSRSTKLVHGGVRYLQQGNISLVLEALKERGILRQNAPHLVHNLPFIVPNYDWWEAPFYGIGLKLYDVLAGRHGFGPSKNISKEKTLEHIPTIETNGLHGGVIYYDGQFDDSRLVINMAETAAEQGATLLNYIRVISLIKQNGFVKGVVAVDQETGTEHELRAKVVINATGVFTDSIRKLDEPEAEKIIMPSQGTHIVLDQSFLPGDSAIMVPHTSDGRVLFAIPWHDRVIVGTTDTPVTEIKLEPTPFSEELDFLLSHAAKYLTKNPEPRDVLSAFAGLRPLVSAKQNSQTAEISRDHTLYISRNGLVTIAGGKWTTYRKMAQDVIDQASVVAALEPRPCVTKDLRLHGYHQNADKFGDLDFYGADAPAVKDLVRTNKEYEEKIHPQSSILKGEVIWATRHEMARTVEDFLARRRRALILNARVSGEMAPMVAELMSKELRHKKHWKKQQIKRYQSRAQDYIL